MYVDQLSPGSNYALASPSISICLLEICLLDRVLFAKSEQPHHRFRMIDRKSGKELSNAIEVHTVEFPRSKSFPPKRRTNKCTTNAKKPTETTNGPPPAPVKKDDREAHAGVRLGFRDREARAGVTTGRLAPGSGWVFGFRESLPGGSRRGQAGFSVFASHCEAGEARAGVRLGFRFSRVTELPH
ncbi:PD-(D/E)XK nuclease family transposase [Neorhodopirellula pilleata]|uniref:PD-(D/E)XK nuclease family transposase n=2 Tax=Neorhodopirellula pilleata TaxID=2714738 RepID=A0A5C6A3F8_9BACT|nr:PD-(D/E)XK nuclease family transposase [Neorhodopirellula pilleata]